MEIIDVPIKALKPYKRNPRKNDKAVEYVANSIREFGFKQPIVIDDQYEIVAGHTRWKAAKMLGMETVPCVMADDLTPEQVQAYRLADNKTAEMADWDFDLLEQELNDIDPAMFDMADFGFFQGDEISKNEQKEVTDDDFNPDEEVESRCKRGQVWQLGKHRLMCGDSTDPAVIDRLMDGVKADMVFTDPPYALVGNSTGLGSATDDMLKPFFLAIFQNICKFTHDLMHVYVCCDWKSCNAILTEAKKTKLTEKSLIVWDKESIGLGSPYMSQYELIWFFENHKQKTMQAGKTEYKNRRNIKGKSNVWKYKRVQDREHNAQKPVELVAEALNNSCFENEIVLDLFGGSGSTLIACEQLNRRCYMCELDPHYCDVIIKRWENLTGKKAELIEE